MKRRIFAWFLCIVMGLSLTACGTVDSPGTDSGDAGEDKPVSYDASMEHKFIACDIKSHGIVVFDLNLCSGDWQKLTDDSVSVIWEWDPEEDPNLKSKGPEVGIDSAKYRYSEYYKEDVIIACSSNGWCGVISYKDRTLLWEYMLTTGPHSVEMLPNGDLLVAASYNPGGLYYIPLSAGIKRPVTRIESLYCHGVSWDPKNQCLWVLEYSGVYRAEIKNLGTRDAEIVRVEGGAVNFVDDNDGHAFAPVAGQPGKYWASAAGGLWIFDAETKTLAKAESNLAKSGIKGICSFADGTVIQAVANLCGKSTNTWSCDGLRIITKEVIDGEVKDVETIVPFTAREFYKIQAFTKDYQ